MTGRFTGVYPALLTAFSDDGRHVDVETLGGHVHWLLQRGVSGLYVCGTTGEFALLSVAERKQVAAVVTAEVAGRVPVVIHVGCMTTADTVALARHAEEAGADAIAVVTPWYHAYDEEALFAHYRTVATAVPDMPVLLYHIPSHGRNEVSPGLLQRLAGECGNVIGLKDSGKDLDRTAAYIRAVPGGTVFTGIESHLLATVAYGGSGAVLAVANAFPEAAVALYRAAAAGDLVAARRLQDELAELGAALKGPAGLSLLREAVRLRGGDAGSARAPGRPLTAAEAGALRERLQQLGVAFG